MPLSHLRSKKSSWQFIEARFCLPRENTSDFLSLKGQGLPGRNLGKTVTFVLLAMTLSVAGSAGAETITVGDTAELTAALNKVKGLRTARPSEPITIELAAGVYHLEASLRLDAALSGAREAPTVIRGANDGASVLSAGRRLSGLRWKMQAGGIWRARVPGPAFGLLWLGERRLTRARYPNFDPKTLPLGGVAADVTGRERVARWADPTGGNIHAIHVSRWGDLHIAILGKNPDGTLRLASPTGNNREMGASEKERYVDNIREELDAGDEWYFDAKDGWLYYKPLDGHRPPADGFIASHLEQIVEIGDALSPAHDIRLEQLSFRHTEPTFGKTNEPLLRSDWKFHRGGAVLIENAYDVQIDDGDFAELGGNGIVVSGHARGIAIRRNEITRIGASAVAIVGRPEAVRSPLFEYHESQPLARIDRIPGPKTDAYPADSVVEDNLIHDNGFLEKQSAGVEIAMAARISLIHNSIYHLPRSGINVGDGTWGGHQIIGNDVFDTVRETGDHGSFNSWGRDRFWDPDRAEMERRVTAEPSLTTLDAVEPIVIRHNRWRCDHGWDIDLDDGSSNYIIEDNLMLSGGLKFREGFYRTARNNIMVNNTFHPHVWFTSSEDVFEHNIVMSAYQPIRVPTWGKSVDYNLFPSKGALDRARAAGTDLHSVYGAPGFESPSTGNFTVSAESPALKIGFKNFPMDDFGVRIPRLKARAARPVFSEPAVSSAAGAAEVPRDYAGMRIKSVETVGEQSAAGLPEKAGVMVLSVEQGERSARAGLRPGDVIIALTDGSGAVEEAVATAADFLLAAQGRQWRGEIDIAIIRNQQRQHLRLNLR